MIAKIVLDTSDPLNGSFMMEWRNGDMTRVSIPEMKHFIDELLEGLKALYDLRGAHLALQKAQEEASETNTV